MMLAVAGNAKVFWYLTRGMGVGALILLTASVALGVLTSVRWRSLTWPRFVTAGLHRNLTLLAIVFVAVHVLTTVADGYTSIALKDAVIPFVSPYRPIWLGLGAISFDLLIALVATSLLRDRIGYRAWRYVHWLAYASWPVALVHGLGTGTDARLGWMQLVAGGCVAVVALAVLARAAVTTDAPAALRAGAALGAVVVPLGIFVWYLSGPSQRGWARRAGTPVSLLASRRAGRVTVRSALATPVSLPHSAFSSSLSGTLQQGGTADGLVDVVIRGVLHGGAGGSVRIDLQGQGANGGVSMTSSGVSYVPAGTSTVYIGSVTALDGQRVFATVVAPGGSTLQLSFRLNIDTRRKLVTGTMTGTPG
ncbi:MAG TPA: ferric reductase-like transmembrane domain-containing protein [Gaiellaceae bacterium]|nr:ferric reductase-like transmembrane domain-containing protein [Gaiellaceae bacterium]